LKVTFSKMQGIGNDYIYVDGIPDVSPNAADVLSVVLEHPRELARVLSNRNFGVGGDGLVFILPSSKADFRMQMFNADGSESQMCGNAIRCVGKYLYERGRTRNRRLEIETPAGNKILELQVRGDTVETVRVDMGEPILEAKQIPVSSDKNTVVAETFSCSGYSLPMTCVSMGNPHAVFFVDHITDDMVLRLGPQIETHSLFPEKTNVEFVEVLSPAELRMRVWERGTGETLACGTGASAVAVAASLNGLAERSVVVHLLGGDLKIEWADNNHVYKTGPAEFVFDGTVDVRVE
jgi:diaminopimelate epimerase